MSEVQRGRNSGSGRGAVRLIGEADRQTATALAHRSRYCRPATSTLSRRIGARASFQNRQATLSSKDVHTRPEELFLSCGALPRTAATSSHSRRNAGENPAERSCSAVRAPPDLEGRRAPRTAGARGGGRRSSARLGARRRGRPGPRAGPVRRAAEPSLQPAASVGRH